MPVDTLSPKDKKQDGVPKLTVKELKERAAKLAPIVPPPGYRLDPDSLLKAGMPQGHLESYTPSIIHQMRDTLANSAVGRSLQQEMPKVAAALNLTPSETIQSPTYKAHGEQLLAPEYLAPAVAKLSPVPLTQAGKERVEGALGAIGGLTSGKSMATMAGTAVAAGATAGIVNPASAQVLSRLVSGGFTLDMLHGLYQQHKEYRKAVDSGNETEAHKIQGEMGVTGIMALLTGKHALTSHPFTPIAPKDVPTRARTNVLYRSPMGEVRQAKGEAPSVWMSPDAWKSFMGALYPEENHLATNGLNLPADDRLLSFVQDTNFASDPNMAEVQKLLGEAHKVADKGGVAIGSKTGRGVQHAVNVMREELNHTWQRKLTDSGNYDEHLKPGVFSHLNRNIPQGMYDHLIDNGYDEYNSPQMASEAAVKLMDGRPERFGVNDDQAVDYLDNYFNEVANQHGAQALESLKHVRGIAAETKARIIDEHNRYANGGANGGTVQGVADRGQGSAAQGLPSEGGKVNDDQLGTTGGRGVPGVEGGGQAGLATPAEAVENIGQATVDPSATGELATNAIQPGSSVPTALPGGEKTSEDTLFNRDKEKPTWYLKSERLIGDKMKGPQSAEDVHKMLISGGVKPEEMQWTGLDDFLKAKGKDKVTPQEIKDHLAANNLQIKEVTKGAPVANRPTQEESNEMYHLIAESQRRSLSPQEQMRLDDLESGSEASSMFGKQTKYESYVLPGGTNYQEKLLTMPQPEFDPSKVDIRISKNKWGESADIYYDGKLMHEDADDFDPEDPNKNNIIMGWAKDAYDRGVNNAGAYKSGHWDEVNPVSHVRYNDRTGSNGEKLLHLEEIQSDWRAARRQQEEVKAAKEKLTEIDNKIESFSEKMRTMDQKGNPERVKEIKKQHAEALDERRDLKKEIENKDRPTPVPEMPFEGSWHEMTLRRMLKHAVDQGYHGMSWTGGEDQIARYDLSKQVSEIRYKKGDNGKYSIDVYPHEGSKETIGDLDAHKLADTVGKEVAQKIIDGEGEDSIGGRKRLVGDDLKVGGAGKRRLYDKIVPDYLNKFGKKFGAKVGETEFPVPGDKRITIRRGINGWDVESRLDENIGREQGLAFFSDEDFGGREGAQKAAQKDAEDRSAPKKKVQYLPITPEMRKSVGQEGVPLFNKEKNPNAEQDSPTSLVANTNTEGVGGQLPEPVEGGSESPAPTTVIPIQGGTELRSAPAQEPVVKVPTTAHHITTSQVTVPLQTAMDVTPVMTKRVLPLSQLIALAAAHNPSHQVGNVRELMKEAKRRDPTRLIP